MTKNFPSENFSKLVPRWKIDRPLKWREETMYTTSRLTFPKIPFFSFHLKIDPKNPNFVLLGMKNWRVLWWYQIQNYFLPKHWDKVCNLPLYFPHYIYVPFNLCGHLKKHPNPGGNEALNFFFYLNGLPGFTLKPRYTCVKIPI